MMRVDTRATSQGVAMTGPGLRGPRIHQTILAAFAVMLLACGWLSVEPPAYGGRIAAQAASPAANSAPLYLLATGAGSLPEDSELVWLVRQGAVSGEQRVAVSAPPLGFALAQRGVLAILGLNGARVSALDPGRAAFLPPDFDGAFASVSGDVALYVQIALVPVSAVPRPLPPRTLVSEPFSTTAVETLALELARGLLNPDRAAALPASDVPALLLAIDNAIQVEIAAREPVAISRDETLLLADAATVRNLGQQPATFVVARVVSRPADSRAAATLGQTGPGLQPLDPALDEAWRRLGCHRNPGNPSCLTIGVAAECALDPAAPDCRIDSDGDGCADIAEVRAGFDAFDAADCIGGGQGVPAVNCLFLTAESACDGSRDPAAEDNGCVAAKEIHLRRNPTSLVGCEGAGSDQRPDACTLVARDPRCDGFAPDGG